jgi:TRAP-type uncharacterized transport system fused permease subunit
MKRMVRENAVPEAGGILPESGEPSMKRFLRENWIYIVAPIVIVIVLLGALYFIGGGSDASPFIYNIF